MSSGASADPAEVQDVRGGRRRHRAADTDQQMQQKRSS